VSVCECVCDRQHDDADPTRDVPGFYLLEDYQKLFQSVDDEHDEHLSRIHIFIYNIHFSVSYPIYMRFW
jgi:hypothetical protein